VGVDQSLYMKQLFLIVKLLGWDRGVEFFHVAHGLIRAPSGKFSTRRGKTILLEDVLGEAVKRAGEVLEGSGDKKDLPPEEKEELAKIIGVGAIKYNDLSQHYSRDIIFDWDKILNLKGNSGPYLQYTFARCKSVIRKSGLGEKRKTTLKNLNGEELKILRMICKFPEVVEQAAEKFSPNLLCNFAFDLAQKYNGFYDVYPIIRAETEELRDFRLTLTSAVAQVLKNSLVLLGISAPPRM